MCQKIAQAFDNNVGFGRTPWARALFVSGKGTGFGEGMRIHTLMVYLSACVGHTNLGRTAVISKSVMIARFVSPSLAEITNE